MQMQDLSYKLNNQVLNIEDKKNNSIVKASVEVYSLENIYTVQENTYSKKESTYSSNQVLWGDTELVEGAKVDLLVNETRDGLSFKIDACLDKLVRGVKLRLENLPLGH